MSSLSISRLIVYLNETSTFVGSISISKYPFDVGATVFSFTFSFGSIVGVAVFGLYSAYAHI